MEDKDESRTATRSKKEWQQYWDREVTDSEKRRQKFLDRGEQAVKRFVDDRDYSGDFTPRNSNDNFRNFKLNFFHANIETMKAMLAGSMPSVEVQREFSDPNDDDARVAAVMLQRLLQQNIEANPNNFTETLKACLEDRLVPGLGTARIMYTKEAQVAPDGNEVLFEDAPTTYVHWKDMLWSYARTWSECWWLGYRSYMTREQVIERFGENADQNLQFQNYGGEGDAADIPTDQEMTDSEPRTVIWEIWAKATKEVFWWSRGALEVLDMKDDTLKLDQFYPSPKPMFANLTTSLLMPKADFDISRDLYNEIDILQTRIAIITRAVKVVGTYDANVDGIARMMNEGMENDMIPVDNWAMLAEKGGLKGAIDWFPTTEVAGVLEKLIAVRDQTIQLLYQITGMADILRGQSDQYAGVGQEQIKEKYASIRIQSLQDDFARFASDLQSLKAEVISKHFEPGSIYRQSNAKFLSPPDQQRLMPAMQLIKSPDLMWRVEIRPESIAMVDYAQMQSERTQYMNATATYIQSAQALIKEMPQATPMLISMLKWAVAGFRGSKEIEGVLDAALDSAQQAVQQGMGQEKNDDPAALEQAKVQGQMALNQQKVQGAMQQQDQKHQNAMQLEQFEAQNSQQLEQATHQSDMQREVADMQAALKVISAKLQSDLRVEEAQSGYAMMERDVEHRNTMVEGATDHQYAMTEEEQDARNKLLLQRTKPTGEQS